jgi:hypothetical protein
MYSNHRDIKYRGFVTVQGMPDVVIPNPPRDVLHQYLDCNYDALKAYIRGYIPPSRGDDDIRVGGVYMVDVDVQGVRDYLNLPEDKATHLARVMLDVVNHITSQEIDDVRDRLEGELTALIPASMLIIMV